MSFTYTGVVSYPTMGSATALSSDGGTSATGGPNDNSGRGAFWIHYRTGATAWDFQAWLRGNDSVEPSHQGSALALSAEGNTVAEGAPTDNSNAGAAWVFTRSGSTWSQQGTKLVGTGGTASASQGKSVALSADGNTLAIGGSGDATGAGAAWIFTRTGTTWTQQGSKLVGTGGSATAAQGTAVALNADGNTLAVGGTGDSSSTGATWIFTRSSGSWTQQGSKLVGTGGVGYLQGYSISLSSSGNTVMIGGPEISGMARGGVWYFTRSGSTWTQAGALMGSSGNEQGTSVSLSGTGNIGLFGDPGVGGGGGLVYIVGP